ncbi:hypothetical protein BC830DRAFT_418791 [Chytriomyces sp. MP71]|nr:hypothetical protein BC830DRAFT_418791 [Chytriomyces sp. MP71]
MAATAGVPDAASAMRRTKSGIVVSLLCMPRKKLRSCAAAAQKLLDAIVASEPDKLVVTLARLVRPFVEMLNPGVIHFHPTIFRYLDPQITHRVRTSNSLSTVAARPPVFAVENTWLLHTFGTEEDTTTRTVASMKLSNQYLFGPAKASTTSSKRAKIVSRFGQNLMQTRKLPPCPQPSRPHRGLQAWDSQAAHPRPSPSGNHLPSNP